MEELNNSVVKEGDKVRLACKVEGYPIPRLIFHRNNMAIHEDGEKTVIGTFFPSVGDDYDER